MTMKHVYTFLLGSIGSTLAAQPTINLGNFGVTVGESFTIHAGPWVDPGGTGMDYTWDLTGLTTDSTYVITYIDPATTPDAASFPTATVALEEAGGFSYLELIATGGTFLGRSDPVLGVQALSDPHLTFAFPCTYGTTWTDTDHGDFTIAGFPVVRDGTSSGDATGYGTLDLPWGTLTDVLRLDMVWDWTDSVDAGFPVVSTYHNEFTYFIQAGTHFPIVELFSNTAVVFGSTSTVTGVNWLPDISTSIAGASASGTGLSVRPNPANEVIALTGNGSSLLGVRSTELFDASGRFVRSVLAHELASMNVASLEPGLYVLRLAYAEELVRLPFIKQ